MARDESIGLEIRSPLDGSTQRATLRLPARAERGAANALPLILAPHAFGWTVEDDYHGGCVGLKAPGHPGWLDVAADLDVAILQPEGHHRVVEWCSMGYEGVVRDIPAWVDAAERMVGVDRDRIYACGLSMGGLESLLIAGTYPDVVAAAFAFNPVVDAAAWYEDLLRTTNDELRAEGGAGTIAREVGGTPGEVPDAYAARSAFGVLDGLRHVPVAIWWSHLDLVVPRQAERHGKRLYDELKRLEPTAPVTEYDHTDLHRLPASPSDDQRWGVHETADYRFAATWLLLHRLSARQCREPGRSAEPPHVATEASAAP
jgi:dipeptidyl aminopeptidase/acylaminoacyl peptidase